MRWDYLVFGGVVAVFALLHANAMLGITNPLTFPYYGGTSPGVVTQAGITLSVLFYSGLIVLVAGLVLPRRA